MLGIDKGCNTALFLSLGNSVKRKGCFAGCFRAENLTDPAPGKPPGPKRFVQPE